MSSIELNAELRTDLGKGASRRLRHAEKMPAILYGAGKDPVGLTLEQKAVRALQSNEAFYSSVLDLKVDGKAEQVIIRDVQHHPFRVELTHIDFLRVDNKSELRVHVPLHYINEEKCPGVKQFGGQVSHLAVEVEIECLPKDIPEFIEVDIIAMNVGDILHLSDIKVPEGVEILALKQGDDHDTAIVSVHLPKGGASLDEEEAEGEEAAGEAEGEAED